MRFMTTKVVPEVHRIIDHEVGRAVCRELNDDSFFIYWHAQTQNWVIAKWVNKARRLMAEFLVLNKDPDQSGPLATPENMMEIRKIWNGPKDPKKWMRIFKQQEDHLNERDAEEAHERMGELRSIARKHNLDKRYAYYDHVVNRASAGREKRKGTVISGKKVF